MKLTKIEEIIALNEKAETACQSTLDAAINVVNKSLGKKELPTPEAVEDVATALQALAPITQWLAVQEALRTYAKNNELTELTEEQMRTAITKARWFSTWVVKQNKDTGLYYKDTRKAKIDILGMLDKLKVDLTSFKESVSAIMCSVALIADKRVNKGAGKQDILARYKFGDTGNLESLKAAVQYATNVYLPSAGYNATDEDGEFFYAIALKLDKKKIGSIKAGLANEVYMAFFDFASELLNKNGKVSYNIAYSGKESPTEYTYKTAEDAVVEAPTTEAPTTEAPTTEPKEEAKTKRGSKGSKKSDKAAA